MSAVDTRPPSTPDPEGSSSAPAPPRQLGPVRQLLEEYGDLGRFIVDTIRELPRAAAMPGEVLRQAAILILGSATVIWVMQFVMGMTCGLEASYTLRSYGAPLYSGIFTAWCAVREMAPYMWGYILAAKVGCGFVAEIGSMRISEEIDALEVIGVRSMPYLVGTRVIGAFISLPFLYMVGLLAHFAAAYLVVVHQLGEVSQGGYAMIFWSYQDGLDLLYSLIKVMVKGMTIVLVGCYYGYRARGGPVGVGFATARSMILNMVLVHLIGLALTQLFWGSSPNAPIAN